MKEIARTADQAPMVRAERLDLLIRQSSRAAYTGILMAFLLAAILWYQADRLELFFLDSVCNLQWLSADCALHKLWP